MLARYCELAREIKPYARIALEELSIDDVSHYLELRREYEEIQNKLVGLIPSIVKQIGELLKKSQENLEQLKPMMDSIPADYARQKNSLSLREIVEVIGELEVDAKKISAKSSLLEDLWLRHQDLGGTSGQQQVACTLETSRQSENHEKKETKKGEEGQKQSVSLETIKKIEMMVRPKETTVNKWVSPREENPGEKIIKIAAPPEPKKPQKNSKDRARR